MRLRHLLILLCALILTGCGGTRVILLDNDKPQSAVIVRTRQGEVTLTEPNSYADVSSAGSVPSTPKKLDPQEIRERYAGLFAVAPQKSHNFLLYFLPNSTTPTDESRRLLNEVEQAIRERAPCDINIIGHADRSGSKDYNILLSLQRARWVRDWIFARDLDITNIFVESYGEEDPLVPTADGVAEPRNRRVEIQIR